MCQRRAAPARRPVEWIPELEDEWASKPEIDWRAQPEHHVDEVEAIEHLAAGDMEALLETGSLPCWL